MKRVRKPVLLLAMLAISAVLAAACGTPRPAETPTVLVRAITSVPDTPTHTATPTPTHTRTPTPTPLPTRKPTPLPPTATSPPPTATATPSPPPPSATPTATAPSPPPSATPLPPTATAVQPAATATPWWSGKVENTFPNCGHTRLMGLTWDRNGRAVGDVWLHWWAEGWEGAWGVSRRRVNEGYANMDDSSNWDGILDRGPKAGTWHVCVVPAEGSWECRSPIVTARTVAEPCAPESSGVQVVRIIFQQN